MSRLAPQPGERIDRDRRAHLHLRRQAGPGLRRGHDRLRPVRRRPAHLLALVQVPPPARRAVRLRAVLQLARAGRRPAGRAGLLGASCARAWRSSTRTRCPVSTSTSCAPPTWWAGRSRRRASTTRRSSGRAACGRCTRRCCATSPASASCPSARTSAAGARSTAGATATCWSSAAGSPASRRRCAPPSSGPTSCCATTTSSPAGRCWPKAGTSGRARSPRRPARRAWRSSPARAALGFYDGLVPVWQGDTLHQIRAARHVAATGTLEQPLVFPDNDLPGVMLAGGARRLAALYAVKPGETAVVATTGDRGLDAALALHAAGVRVAAVADLRPDAGGGALAERVRAAGIELLPRRHGGARPRSPAVTGAVLGRVDAAGLADPATLREVECDLLAVSGGAIPSTSLLLQGGAKARYDEATRPLRRRVAAPAGARGRRGGGLRGRRRRRAVRPRGRRRGGDRPGLRRGGGPCRAARPATPRRLPAARARGRPRRPTPATAGAAARRSSTSTRTRR